MACRTLEIAGGKGPTRRLLSSEKPELTLVSMSSSPPAHPHLSHSVPCLSERYHVSKPLLLPIFGERSFSIAQHLVCWLGCLARLHSIRRWGGFKQAGVI